MQLRIPTCKNKLPLPFDFGIYKADSLIGLVEFQGKQHYFPVQWFGGQKVFEKNQIRDQIKKDYCKKNMIPFLCISYNEDIPNRLNVFLNTIGAL